MIDPPQRISPPSPPWRVRSRDPYRDQPPPRREHDNAPEKDEGDEGEQQHQIDVRA